MDEDFDRRRPLGRGPSGNTGRSSIKGEPASRQPVFRSVIPLFIYFGAEGKPRSAAQPLRTENRVHTENSLFLRLWPAGQMHHPLAPVQKQMLPTCEAELAKHLTSESFRLDRA